MVQFPARSSQHPTLRSGHMETPSLIFRFGPFEAKPRAQELSKNGTPLRLRGQPFAILELLLNRAGEVVTREEIRQKLWPADTFVDFEHGLNTSIKKLRQALCDSATEPRYIETIPRLGYRFIAPVKATVEPKAKKPTGVETVAEEDSKHPVSQVGGGRPRLHLFLAPAVLVLAAAALVFNMAGARTRLFALFRSTKNASVAVASAPKPLPSIAVLPLQNLSNNSAEDYFADGMTDELTTDLAQFGSLRVISRTSAMHYKGASKTAPEIGRELGVDTLIEGTVQRVGDRVRIRVQLIDSASDRHLWARSYDHDLKDVLALQSSAARDIAEEVEGKVVLPPANAPLNPHASSPSAYEAYLKGRYFWNKRTEDGLTKEHRILSTSHFARPEVRGCLCGLGR